MTKKKVSRPLGCDNCEKKPVFTSSKVEQQYDKNKKPVLVAEGATVVDLSLLELMKEINELKRQGRSLSELKNVTRIKALSSARAASQPNTKNKVDEGFELDD